MDETALRAALQRLTDANVAVGAAIADAYTALAGGGPVIPPVVPPPEPPQPPVVPPPTGTYRKIWAYDAPVPTVVGEPWKRDITGDVADCVSISFVPPAGMKSLRITYAQMPVPRSTYYSLSPFPADFNMTYSLATRGDRACANASIVVSTTGEPGHVALTPGQRYYFNVHFSSAVPGSFGYEFRLEAQN